MKRRRCIQITRELGLRSQLKWEYSASDRSLNARVLQSRTSGATPQATAAAATTGKCWSDYECGVGKQCVKPLYQMQGTCLLIVNQFGTPTNAMPRPESGTTLRTQPTCRFDTDCTTGFRCDTQLATCVR